jgi:DNA polymerase-3 subunit beta
MKILCDRTALQEAVNVVSSVVPVKTTKPILQNFLVRADGDGITLFATDLEMAATRGAGRRQGQQEGLRAAAGPETAALLRELSDPTVTLESTDQRCRIESGGGSFVLLGEDPQQFPTRRSGQVGQEDGDLPADACCA